MRRRLCVLLVCISALAAFAGESVASRTDGQVTNSRSHAVTAKDAQNGATTDRAVRPLIQAHAHNDYEHPRPLLDALDQGFCSVEADIWLIDGQLLVAHDRANVKPERSLQALYLDPLRARIRSNGGRVYVHGPPCTLMIDVKSEAVPTYAMLRHVLRAYADILTEFTPTNTTTKALTVILTGNRPTEMVAAESLRQVALDGRLADLESNASTNLYPLISDNWQPHFNWRGEGPLLEAEREKLRQYVQPVHERGRRLRFWGVPDSVVGWRELQNAGVDLIGTDDLPGLAGFLRDAGR